jgi:cell division protein FtsW (lipid II flippase)
MHSSSRSLFILATPPIIGSFIVLALANVGSSVWITHLLAIALACCLALADSFWSKLGDHEITAFAIVILTLIALALPLLGHSSEPERWISLGPIKLYVAPLLLPSFIAACSMLVGKNNMHQMISLLALLGAGLLLALQPDASQVLGLMLASAVVVVRGRLGIARLCLGVFPLVLMSSWAFYLPDPFMPVPHVEEVFALALDHSVFAGIALIGSASALIVGLWMQSASGAFWLSAVATYYTVLFACSIAGITPAPLLGYGAGPILGFGLMVGLHGWFEGGFKKSTTARTPEPRKIKPQPKSAV